MAYKITKYKGKTKIKDTKTGKSVEVDIEKLMYGGEKKKVPSYQLGVEFDCPPGDEECLARKQAEKTVQGLDPLAAYMPKTPTPAYSPIPYRPGEYPMAPYTGPTTTAKQEDIVTEEKEQGKRPLTSRYGSTLTPKGYSEGINVITSLDETKLGESDMTLQSNSDTGDTGKEKPDFNIYNPYGEVDIPTAANYLGRSIENGDTLGITAGALKTLTGLGRNVMSGMGYQNRYNQTMQDYYEKQKESANPVQYYAEGGKQDAELATGEYMSGIDNTDIQNYNAEVEAGEYLQTNQGDIAEVVGEKHANGGEKIQMEQDDRVLSDKLKLGAKTAKELSGKYDLKLKASDTYSTVLDKYRKKTKLDKLVEEEVDLIKKIDAQSNIMDSATRDLNLQVLNEKRKEILEAKSPIEEQRKEMFEELFNIQEESKGSKPKKQDDLELGGTLESLAKEYGVPLERARELVEQYKYGGVKKYEEGGPGKGQKVSRQEAEKKVKEGVWKDLGGGQYIEEGTNTIITTNDVRRPSYIDAWNSGEVDKNTYPTYQDFRKAAEEYNKSTKTTPDKYYYARMPEVATTNFVNPATTLYPLNIKNNIGLTQEELARIPSEVVVDENGNVKFKEPKERATTDGLMMLPYQAPLPPSALQGTIKPEARFDRVSSTEIDIEPYLQDLRDKESAQVRLLEGLSPNERVAALSNMRANTQRAESDSRMKIDTQDLSSAEKALYTNAQIQRQEDILNNNYRQGYEARQYRAQALTDQEINDYYNNLRDLNIQKFKDIHNLNLINARNEDMAYVPGRGFVRKTTDKELLDKALDKTKK